jgi:hypothetical protein
MDQKNDNGTARVDQLAEEIQLLVDVCRLIAGRANDPDIADELIDLADSMDQGIDRLRDAIARSVD